MKTQSIASNTKLSSHFDCCRTYVWSEVTAKIVYYLILRAVFVLFAFDSLS